MLYYAIMYIHTYTNHPKLNAIWCFELAVSECMFMYCVYVRTYVRAQFAVLNHREMVRAYPLKDGYSSLFGEMIYVVT